MASNKKPIGNPLEEAIATGKIGAPIEEAQGGGKQENSSPPALQPSSNINIQNARIPEFQSATNEVPEQFISTFNQNSRTPERQDSSLPERQSMRTPAFRRSKQQTTPKTNADGWEQQTTYLPPDLRQWLRHYALDTNQEMSEIIAIALQEYRQRQQQRGRP